MSRLFFDAWQHQSRKSFVASREADRYLSSHWNSRWQLPELCCSTDYRNSGGLSYRGLGHSGHGFSVKFLCSISPGIFLMGEMSFWSHTHTKHTRAHTPADRQSCCLSTRRLSLLLSIKTAPVRQWNGFARTECKRGQFDAQARRQTAYLVSDVKSVLHLQCPQRLVVQVIYWTIFLVRKQKLFSAFYLLWQEK